MKKSNLITALWILSPTTLYLLVTLIYAGLYNTHHKADYYLGANAWSPLGDQLQFRVHFPDSGYFTINADGSNPTRINQLNAWDVSPICAESSSRSRFIDAFLIREAIDKAEEIIWSPDCTMTAIVGIKERDIFPVTISSERLYLLRWDDRLEVNQVNGRQLLRMIDSPFMPVKMSFAVHEFIALIFALIWSVLAALYLRNSPGRIIRLLQIIFFILICYGICILFYAFSWIG